MKTIRHDSWAPAPCPVHGFHPVLLRLSNDAGYLVRCPAVYACGCTTDLHHTDHAAMTAWDEDFPAGPATPVFPVLAFESGEDDTPDPYDPEPED